MCSSSSISSTFRQDKPRQLNCTVLWSQLQVKETSCQMLQLCRADVSETTGLWILRGHVHIYTQLATFHACLWQYSNLCTWYKDTIIWALGLISPSSFLHPSTPLFFLPCAASPHSCFEFYSKLQPHYSAACSAGLGFLSPFLSLWSASGQHMLPQASPRHHTTPSLYRFIDVHSFFPHLF